MRKLIFPLVMIVALILSAGAAAIGMYDVLFSEVHVVGDSDTYAEVSVIYPDGRIFTTGNITFGGSHRRVPIWQLDNVIIEVRGDPEWIAVTVEAGDNDDHFLYIDYPPGAVERFVQQGDFSVATYDWD